MCVFGFCGLFFLVKITNGSMRCEIRAREQVEPALNLSDVSSPCSLPASDRPGEDTLTDK